MFRELLQFATQSISQSGKCSLQLQTTPECTKLYVSFWSGNVLNHLLLAEITPCLMEAKKILEVAGCFLAVTNTPVAIYSLLGSDARTVKTLQTELHQVPPPCAVPTFSYEDLYKVLTRPAIKILDRYDLHSVLHFFLMKLRTALDTAWMGNLPELRSNIQKFHFTVYCQLSGRPIFNPSFSLCANPSWSFFLYFFRKTA